MYVEEREVFPFEAHPLTDDRPLASSGNNQHRKIHSSQLGEMINREFGRPSIVNRTVHRDFRRQ